MTFFYYSKETGLVAFYTGETIEVDVNIFDSIYLEPTEEEKTKIESNQYNIFIKNGKLDLHKKPEVIAKEERQALIAKIVSQTATEEEIAKFLNL